MTFNVNIYRIHLQQQKFLIKLNELETIAGSKYTIAEKKENKGSNRTSLLCKSLTALQLLTDLVLARYVRITYNLLLRI